VLNLDGFDDPSDAGGAVDKQRSHGAVDGNDTSRDHPARRGRTRRAVVPDAALPLGWG
jgi:hypothetical protein